MSTIETRRSGLCIDVGPDPYFIDISSATQDTYLSIRFDCIVAIEIPDKVTLRIVTPAKTFELHLPNNAVEEEDLENVHMAHNELLQAILDAREFNLDERTNRDCEIRSKYY